MPPHCGGTKESNSQNMMYRLRRHYVSPAVMLCVLLLQDIFQGFFMFKKRKNTLPTHIGKVG